MNKPFRWPQRRGRLAVLSLILIGLVAIIFFEGPNLRRELLAWSLIRSAIPDKSAFEEVVEAENDPIPFLERMFDTGQIVHCELAVEALNQQARHEGVLDRRVERLLTIAARGPDMSAREVALGALATAKSPRLGMAAAVQLTDADPQGRLLGVQLLARLDARQSLPRLVPLLDDSDLRVVATVDAAFRRWTGLDTGVRIAQAVLKSQPDGPDAAENSAVESIRQGARLRKAWWELHKADYSMPVAELSSDLPAGPSPGKAADFVLSDLKGQTRRLSHYRGKIVLLNFWTTWCTACLSETPDLVELQKHYADRLVILGISLDGLPDNHGHAEGRDPAQESNAPAAPSPAVLQAKVARVAATRGMTYTVLLDSNRRVGGRFNGGELPTNVLIDQDGRIRRRFVGGRPLPAWDAMIGELVASKSSPR